MATYSGFDFTTVRGVNLKNSAAIRVQSEGFTHTVGVKNAADQDLAWYFPQKSGTFPIAGTFEVNLPAMTAATEYGTNVTITGIRVEDGLVCSIQKMGTTGLSERAYPLIAGVQPGAGGALITFFNPSASATVYSDLTIAYAAVR